MGGTILTEQNGRCCGGVLGPAGYLPDYNRNLQAQAGANSKNKLVAHIFGGMKLQAKSIEETSSYGTDC